jgi:hypothetical protein
MKRAPNQPEVAVALMGGVYIRKTRVADAGTVLAQHAHTYAHGSAIVRGAVRIWRGGELQGDFIAPALVEIPAREKHTFQALVPDTEVWCIHSVADGEDVDIHEEHALELED